MKRILAMPNETISGDHRRAFRNGKPLDEAYLAPATAEEVSAPANFPLRKAAQGELFVMGDNRDLSFDSRTAEYAQARFTDVVGDHSMTYWHTS